MTRRLKLSLTVYSRAGARSCEQRMLFECLPEMRKAPASRGRSNVIKIADLWALRQLTFKFDNIYGDWYEKKEGSSATIFGLVPKSKYGFLRNHFPSLVLPFDDLLDFAILMERIGRYAIGHIVQMSEADVRYHMNGRAIPMKHLIECLGQYGLTLNMRAPGWIAPAPSSFDRGCLR